MAAMPLSTLIPESQPSDASVNLVARVFHGLADPTRLRIVQLLLEDEQNVGELVAALGTPAWRVSGHLMRLRRYGFVATRRVGKFNYYRVDDPRVAELVRLAQALFVYHAQAVAPGVVRERER